MSRTRSLFPFFILILLVLIVFGNTLYNQFVFDDMSTIVNNKIIKDFSHIPVLFLKDYFKPSGTGYFTLSGEGSYRPVVTFTYFIDYALWGLSPFGFHLTNLLLHLVTVLVFYLFAVSLLKNRYAALIAAVLYAVHPVMTETVNCISFREDLLCALFFWLTLSLFQYPIKQKSIQYLCIILSSTLCLFSKEMGITLFPSLIIISYFSQYKENSWKRFLSFDYIIVFMITGFYFLVRFYAMNNPYGEHVGYPGNSFSINLIVMQQVIARYLRLLFFPFGLTADYADHFPKTQITKGYIISSSLYALLFISIIISACFDSIRKKARHSISIPSICIVLFFITLIPVMNVIPIKNIIAERYLYLPFGFFAITIAAGLFIYQSNSKYRYFKYSFLVITMLFIITLSSLTVSRNYAWSNGYRLWKSTLRINPKSFHAHNNLASIYDENGQLQKAMYHYHKAIEIRPSDAIPYYNLANTLKNRGDLYEAIRYYKKALDKQARFIEPHVNMGLIYAKLGKYDLAEEEFRQAIRIQPNDSSAHNNLGVVLAHHGKLTEAIREHKIALKLDRYNENAYINLSICYMDLKNYPKTLEALQRLLTINPQHTEANFLAGKSFEASGDYQKALKQYQKTLSIDPHHKQAREHLRQILNQL